MTGKTHDLAAFTALTLVFIYTKDVPQMSVPTLVTALGANFVGGLFPDIDQPTSDFWDNFRLGPFVAKVVVPFLGGHRHISHSLLGFILIAFGSAKLLDLLSNIILIDMNIVWYCFMIGVVSHLVTDLPTKAGVPLLWPIKWYFGIPPFKFLRITGGKFIENFIIFPGLLIYTGFLLYQHQDKILYFLHNNVK